MELKVTLVIALIFISISIKHVESNVISTTIAPENKIINQTIAELENQVPTCDRPDKDVIIEMSEGFNEVLDEFRANQDKIFKDMAEKIQEYKSYSDDNKNFYLNVINSFNQTFNGNIAILETSRSEIEAAIIEIENIAKTEYLNVLEKEKISEHDFTKQIKRLKNRRKLLIELSDCDDCDTIVEHQKVENDLAKIQEEINKLKSKALKKSDGNEEIYNELSYEKLVELNMKNSQLIDVLKKELQEFEKKDKIYENVENIFKYHSEYSSDLDDVVFRMVSNIENLTNSIDVNKVARNLDENAIASPLKMIPMDDTKSNENLTYNWIGFNEDTLGLPESAVIGGKDVDGAMLFVIRIKLDSSYLFGKYVFADERKNAYVTNDVKEFGIQQFEILTAKNYSWCDFDSSRKEYEFPICRTNYKNSTTPGTLLSNGSCRIGFGWNIVKIKDHFEVFSLDSCDVQKNKTNNEIADNFTTTTLKNNVTSVE